MSVKHTAWVWENSRAEGGTLLVALALADAVNSLNDSDECWPRREVLARRVRLSEGQVSRCLGELEELGEVARQRTQSGNRYRLLMPDVRICAERTHAPSDDASVRGSDSAPMRLPYVEPEREPERTGTGTEALFELPDHVQEVFDFYRETVPGRKTARLTREQRQIVRKALEVRDVDTLKRAITGLVKSEHHVENGYLALKYAIGKVKQSETVADRIDMMAAKAPAHTSAPAGTTLTSLYERFPSEARDIVRGWMEDVRAMLRNPTNQGLKTTGESRLEALRSRGIELETDGTRITGWHEVSK